MKNLLATLWNDDRGALIAMEYLFVATILVIGIVIGLVNVREAINVELTELGNAILALSQGYTVSGSSGSGGSVDGSAAIDFPGTLTGPVSTPPAIPSVIDVLPPSPEAYAGGDRTFRCLAGTGPNRESRPSFSR